jgi:hypothetical protein
MVMPQPCKSRKTHQPYNRKNLLQKTQINQNPHENKQHISRNIAFGLRQGALFFPVTGFRVFASASIRSNPAKHFFLNPQMLNIQPLNH